MNIKNLLDNYLQKDTRLTERDKEMVIKKFVI